MRVLQASGAFGSGRFRVFRGKVGVLPIIDIARVNYRVCPVRLVLGSGRFRLGSKSRPVPDLGRVIRYGTHSPPLTAGMIVLDDSLREIIVRHSSENHWPAIGMPENVLRASGQAETSLGPENCFWAVRGRKFE